jgi:hypothetical protein
MMSFPQRLRSRWREFDFMLHQVRRAVDVAGPLGQALTQWPEICRGLAEAPRQRQTQTFAAREKFAKIS